MTDAMSTVILTPTMASAKIRAATAAIREVATAYGPTTTVTVDTLDLNQIAAALTAHRSATGSIARSVTQTCQARVLVVLTPLHHDGVSGIVKLFLDLLPRGALHGTSSFGVGLAGSSRLSGTLTYALNPILAALGTDRLLPSVHVLPADWVIASEGATLLSPSRETLAHRMQDAHRLVLAHSQPQQVQA